MHTKEITYTHVLKERKKKKGKGKNTRKTKQKLKRQSGKESGWGSTVSPTSSTLGVNAALDMASGHTNLHRRRTG